MIESLYSFGSESSASAIPCACSPAPTAFQFASLPDEQRAIVTRDLADFRPLLAEAVRSGSQTCGLVCVPRRFSLSREGIGRLVRALDALLQAHPEADAAIALGGEIWLEDRAAT
jgi:hypothetical protein